MKKAKIKREVPAAEVTGVQYRPGVFSRLKVTTSGRDLKMMPHRKADAERFAREFEHLLRTGALPS